MADKIGNFEGLFLNGLELIYDCEKQLTQALTEMAESANSAELRRAFGEHQRQTQQQLERVDRICGMLGVRSTGKSNKVMQSMTKQAGQMMKNIEKSPLRDAALIVAGNEVEHYELAAYGSLRTFAELLGRNDIVPLLEQNLDEEREADRRLTKIGEQYVNAAAAQMRGPYSR